MNDAGPARWGVRNAYGSFLPTASVAGDFGYVGEGQSDLGGGLTVGTSAFLSSGYSLALNWQLDGRVLSGPGQQKALQKATEEDITGAGINLRYEITTQYLNTLQAIAQVDVARQQVVRNADFLSLARARYQVGQATLLDVRQAEVAKGQSDVTLLRTTQLENEAKLDLLRRMGVEPPVAVDQIGLTDSFPVTPPDFKLDELLALADEQNPLLRSAPRTAGRRHLERAGGALGVPANPVCAGRMERVHPGVHQRQRARGTDAVPLAVRRGGAAITTTR